MDRLEQALRQLHRTNLTRQALLKAGAAAGAASVAAKGAASQASALELTNASAIDYERGAVPSVAQEPQRGGLLVFATRVATPNLDPYMEISDARMRRSPLMYDTLVE